MRFCATFFFATGLSQTLALRRRGALPEARRSVVASDRRSKCDAAHRLGEGPFRFGRRRGQKLGNERIRFRQTKRRGCTAGRKPLKSLRVGNQDSAGSFVFNGLSAISFRSFLACGSSVQKGRLPRVRTYAAVKRWLEQGDQRRQIPQFRSLYINFCFAQEIAHFDVDTARLRALCFD